MRFHVPNPVLVSLCSTAIAFGNLANANPVDQAFRKAEATPNRITTKIHTSVYEDMGLSMRELQSKVDDGDRRAEERNSRSTGTAASSQSSNSSNNRSATPSAKTFVCTIYCNSASGPTIRRETLAKSRADAAKILGDQADSLCRVDGHARASSLSLPERQCREK